MMRAQTQGTHIRRVELDPAIDLLAYVSDGGFFFEQDGDGIATSGTALSIPIAAGHDQVARAADAAAEVLDRMGEHAIVVGALPFDHAHPATLTVPAAAVVRRGGRSYALLAGDAEVPSPTWPTPLEQAGSIERIPDPDPQVYLDAVEAAVRRIKSGELGKVVLARTLRARSSRDFPVRSVLARLRNADHHAYVFSTGGSAPMIGATPELLVARAGGTVRANPLAGSVRRGDPGSGDPGRGDADAARGLLDSAKDRSEHAYVVKAVLDALSPACSTIDAAAVPTLLATSRVWHLSTPVQGTLTPPRPNALALAARMHPTPAVCGTPRDRALAAIRELEPVDRGLYAGIVGWMDGSGDGEWAIALRCAAVEGREARLYAGAGIVEASDPAAELAETDAKLEVLLAALGDASRPPA